jgi:hypothetical protein
VIARAFEARLDGFVKRRTSCVDRQRGRSGALSSKRRGGRADMGTKTQNATAARTFRADVPRVVSLHAGQSGRTGRP